VYTKTLPRMIMPLFGTKSKPSAYERFPDEYYKSIYLSKKMFDGVELVAKIEGKARRRQLTSCLKQGSSVTWGEN